MVRTVPPATAVRKPSTRTGSSTVYRRTSLARLHACRHRRYRRCRLLSPRFGDAIIAPRIRESAGTRSIRRRHGFDQLVSDLSTAVIIVNDERHAGHSTVSPFSAGRPFRRRSGGRSAQRSVGRRGDYSSTPARRRPRETVFRTRYPWARRRGWRLQLLSPGPRHIRKPGAHVSRR